MYQPGGSPSQFAPPLVSSRGMGLDGTLRQAEFPQPVRVTFHIDSRDRDYDLYPSSSQFVVELPEMLKNVRSAVLVTAELPITYYVFSAARGTNSLRVTLGAVTRDVTIPDGNYTTSTMAAALKAALEAAFAGTTFTVTFDAASLKCTITASSGILVVDTVAAPAGPAPATQGPQPAGDTYERWGHGAGWKREPSLQELCSWRWSASAYMTGVCPGRYAKHWGANRRIMRRYHSGGIDVDMNDDFAVREKVELFRDIKKRYAQLRKTDRGQQIDTRTFLQGSIKWYSRDLAERMVTTLMQEAGLPARATLNQIMDRVLLWASELEADFARRTAHVYVPPREAWEYSKAPPASFAQWRAALPAHHTFICTRGWPVL